MDVIWCIRTPQISITPAHLATFQGKYWARLGYLKAFKYLVFEILCTKGEGYGIFKNYHFKIPACVDPCAEHIFHLVLRSLFTETLFSSRFVFQALWSLSYRYICRNKAPAYYPEIPFESVEMFSEKYFHPYSPKSGKLTLLVCSIAFSTKQLMKPFPSSSDSDPNQQFSVSCLEQPPTPLCWGRDLIVCTIKLRPVLSSAAEHWQLGSSPDPGQPTGLWAALITVLMSTPGN